MKTLEIREKSQDKTHTNEMTHTSTAKYPRLQNLVPNDC